MQELGLGGRTAFFPGQQVMGRQASLAETRSGEQTRRHLEGAWHVSNI